LTLEQSTLDEFATTANPFCLRLQQTTCTQSYHSYYI